MKSNSIKLAWVDKYWDIPAVSKIRCKLNKYAAKHKRIQEPLDLGNASFSGHSATNRFHYSLVKSKFKPALLYENVGLLYYKTTSSRKKYPANGVTGYMGIATIGPDTYEAVFFHTFSSSSEKTIELYFNGSPLGIIGGLAGKYIVESLDISNRAPMSSDTNCKHDCSQKWKHFGKFSPNFVVYPDTILYLNSIHGPLPIYPQRPSQQSDLRHNWKVLLTGYWSKQPVFFHQSDRVIPYDDLESLNETEQRLYFIASIVITTYLTRTRELSSD